MNLSTGLTALVIIALGAINFVVVNLLGDQGLKGSYQNDLEQSADKGKNAFNVLFRILAPVFLIVIEAVLLTQVGLGVCINCYMFALVIYWIMRIGAWCIRRDTVKTRLLMPIAQGVASVLICFYFFEAIGDNPAKYLLPDVKDLSFEFLVLGVTVLVYFLSECPIFWKKESSGSFYAEYEKRLFEIEKLCQDALPPRFHEDVALKLIFYSFALVEDANRPKVARAMERVAHKVGYKKFGWGATTGIMQVKSDRVLTDEESVRLACDIVEQIYDDYLRTSNRLAIDVGSFFQASDTMLSFYRRGYSYSLSAMYFVLADDISSLYGRYCGTYSLDLRRYFEFAWRFVAPRSGLYGDGSVVVRCGMPLVWGACPKDGWERLGEDQGFACVCKANEAMLYRCPCVWTHEDLVEEIEAAGLGSTVLLAYLGINSSIIIVDSKAPEEALEMFAVRASAGPTRTQYSFEKLWRSPKRYLLSLPDTGCVNDGDEEDGPMG